MGIFLSNILDFFKTAFSPKYITITMGVIMFLLIVTLFTTCSNLNREKDAREKQTQIYENNIKASKDSLEVVYDKKLDQLVTQKTSFIVDKMSDLETTNQSLYNEFKDVKKMVAGIKSDVSIIIPEMTQQITNVTQDSKDSSKFTIPFGFDYNDEGLTQTLKGNTVFNIRNNSPQLPITSSLITNNFNIKLRYDVKEKDGKYLVQATSPSPLVKFTELDGVLVLNNTGSNSKKTNRFAFGPYIGAGLNTDIVGQNPRFGWGIGVGLTYNIFSK